MTGNARRILEESDAFDRVLDTLSVHRQPIVRWSQRRVEGYECLLRASEPRLPHPGAILAAAERLGRVHELGRAVRRECVKRPPEGKLFINLHPEDLRDPELYETPADFGCRSSVVFEITERATLGDLNRAKASVRRLKELGFEIALDDIGAGFASLSTLTAIEPNIVKLDMTLIRDIDQSNMKRLLVRTVVRACRDLSSSVVAEGVETRAELETLLELGCDVFQGYYFAKPGPGFPCPNWGDEE
jgi:EAL domain-containing protein (putative c-di-GMP-specific phosphodiesterase class I)